MSLINEALKRTRDGGTQTIQPPMLPPPAASPTLHSPPVAPRRFGRWHFVALIVVGTVIGISGYGIIRLTMHPISASLESPDASPSASAQPLTEPATMPDTPPVVAATAAPEPVDKPTEGESPAAVSVVAAQEAAPPTPVTAPSPPRQPPELKLQGIMRDRSSYEAMINGYNYRVGDTIQGCRVLSIDNQAVRLQFDTQEIELRLR